MRVNILGGINEDIVAHVERLPVHGETVTSRNVTVGAGGKGLNQAMAAARFGAETRMLGAVGNDESGARVLATMRSVDIDCAGTLELAGAATGRAFITLDRAGNNMIVVDAAANDAFGECELNAAIRPAAVSLTQFEACIDAIGALFRHPDAGIKVLNAAPALVEHADYLAMANIVVVNESELQAFAGLDHLPSETDAIAAAARQLLSGNVQTVIVTLGPDGCLLVMAERVAHFAGYDVPVVDTIGAGDCFCGVLVAAIAEGRDIDCAIRLAGAAAALSVGRPGAADSSPERAEIDAFLAERIA